MKNNIDYNYNIESYVNNFIEKFLKTFPGIYKEKELAKIMKENVKDIDFNLNNKCTLGLYLPLERTINLVNLNDEVIFHEFIHGLRLNELCCLNPELNSLEEAFTAYAERIYRCCKNNNFNKTYPDVKYVGNIDRKDKIANISSYNTLVFIVQQLEYLNFLTGNEEPLLVTFLKRKNIYEKIKNIYINYYKSINSQKTEEDAKIDTINLIIKLYNILKIIENEASMIDICGDEYSLEQDEFDELVEIVEEIENETTSIFKGISNNQIDPSHYNKLAILNYIPTRLDRLDLIIFGNEPQEVNIVKRMLKNK